MDDATRKNPGEADDDLLATELTQAVTVSCPYCGESMELVVDPGGGARQEYIEDCQVCCRPWSVCLSFDSDGHPHVSVATLDEE